VSGKFDFIFSAGCREKYQPHTIFDHIKDMAPVFVALLGDNMYADYDGDVNADGIYSLRIEADEFRQVRKTILLKSLSGRAAAMT